MLGLGEDERKENWLKSDVFSYLNEKRIGKKKKKIVKRREWKIDKIKNM